MVYINKLCNNIYLNIVFKNNSLKFRYRIGGKNLFIYVVDHQLWLIVIFTVLYVYRFINYIKNYSLSFIKDAVYIRPTQIQTARAANIVCAAFQYRSKLDHEIIKPV
jgi:hypothetical protein